MSTARVVSIASVVRLQAKGTDGEWRDLTEGSAIESGEEVLCQADAAQFDLDAYIVQRRVDSAWVDAETVTLSVPDGTSNYRQDRWTVNGSETSSTVALAVTVDRGQLLLRDMEAALIRTERSRFTLTNPEGAIATRWRGHADGFDLGAKLEIGGFEQDYKATVIADRQQFAAAEIEPKRGWLLTWGNGMTFRIDSVMADEISYAMQLVSVNR